MSNPKSIVDTLRQQSRGLASFYKANPRLGLGTLGVGLAAPLFLKNEDRGYLQTSLITTPLIVAGSQIAPGLFTEASRQASRLNSSLFSIPKRMNMSKNSSYYDTAKFLQKEYAAKNISLEQLQSGLRNLYKAQTSSVDIARDSSTLLSNLSRVADRSELHSYISNAIHAEKFRTLSASGLRDYLKSVVEGSDAIAPMLNSSMINSAINDQITAGNVDFVRGMNARLQGLVDRKGNLLLKDPGGRSFATQNLRSAMETLNWKDSDTIRARLQEYRPDLFSAISEQIKANNIDPAHLSVVRLRNQAINPIVALRYKDRLNIPVVDELGAIRTGNRYQNVGVSRKFYTANEIMMSDVYAVRHLHHGTKRVEEELGRSNILGLHIDPVDDPFTPYSNLRARSSQVALRSRQVIPANLGNGFMDKNFNSLDPSQQEGAFLNAVKTHGGTKVGGESSVADYIFETGDTENLALFGRVNPEKQNDMWRAFAKPVGLSDTSNAPAPFTNTDFLSKASGGEIKTNQFGAYAAGISPQQRSLFADLRGVEDLNSELVSNNAINAIMSDAKLSRGEASRVWKELSKELSNPKVLQAMAKTQYLGEGGHIMPNNLHGLKVEYTQGFDVHELKNLSVGSVVDSKTIIGYHNGNPLYAGGRRNIVDSISDIGDGLKRVSVRQQFPFGTGAKIDGMVKGILHTVSNPEFKTIKRVLNKYHKLAGTGGFLSDNVNTLSLFNFVQDKADPVNLMMNTASSTLRELDKSGVNGKALASRYAGEFEQVGMSLQDGSLVWNSAHNPGNAAAKEDLIRKSQQITEQMMADVAERIKFHQISLSGYFKDVSRSGLLSGQDSSSLGRSLFEHMSQYNQAFNARAWDHTNLFAPHNATVTFDILQDLSMRGMHGAASDIQNRLKYDGNLMMNRRMEEFLGGNKGAITNTVSLKDALGGKSVSDLDLGTAAGRAGTIFDPGHAAAQDNFLLDLGNGKSVPVLGQEAYGAKVNRYGTGLFSANDAERGLLNMLREGGSADAESGYMSVLKQLNYGKEGYMRAEAVDPLGAGKFITHHSSSLRYADGSVNPFEITMGHDMLRHISDEGTRDALRSGEEVYAAIARHPVSYVPMVRVRLNKDLNNTGMISMDQEIAPLMMADQDKDGMFAYFFRQGSAGHKEAAAEAGSQESLQYLDMLAQRTLEGSEGDVARLAWQGSDIHPKDVMGRVQETFGKSLNEALRRRTASGAIGAFSNTETRLAIALEHNDVITDVASRSKLKRVLFTAIRQTPISAAKLKNEQGGLSFSQALGLNSRLNRSFQPGSTPEEFYRVMQEMSAHAPKGISSFIANNESLFKDFHRGISQESLDMADRLIASAGRASKVGSKSIPNLMPYVTAATQEAGEVSTGARISSEALGSINTATKSVSEIFESVKGSGAGKTLGIGLAAAAVAGVISGSVRHKASFAVPSANNIRPDERMGVDGHVPGEPNAGAMAPSNPPRNIVPAPQGVRTAVVAPMQQTTDVDVQMRGRDRSRAAEVARTISRMSSDGDSNLTINYRDGSRKGSLRSRERMRDVLDQ